MKIVFLDRNTIGEDVDDKVFERFGELASYPLLPEAAAAEKIRDADIVIANKAKLHAGTLAGSKVRLICLTATGTDNVDLSYCEEHRIAVCNLRGYSTESVVQHTFALLFSLLEHIPLFDKYTGTGGYVGDASFRHLSLTFREIRGKTFGIVGMGAIGRRVAEVARAFGCEAAYWSSRDADRSSDFPRLSFDALLEKSDIVSIHSPLTPATCGLFGIEAFRKMKREAVLINVGRGGIVVEEDLALAIESGLIAGAAVDVLSQEPMAENSPLVRLLGDPRFLLTPHIAWAAVEARQRCMREIDLNIEAFLRGERRNRVDTIPDFIL